MNKRGISGLVVTVLIILIALAGVAIIWSFLRITLIDASEQIELKTAPKVNLEVVPGSIKILPEAGAVSFGVERISGEGSLREVIVTIEDDLGNKYTETRNVSIQNFESRMFEIFYGTLPGNIVKITVTPKIGIANKTKSYSDSISQKNTLVSPTTSSPGLSGLVGYWNFNNDLKDYSGNGNDLTAQGGATFTAGKKGQAANFDGVDDYLKRDSPTNMPLGNSPRTFAAWIKLSDLDNAPYGETWTQRGSSQSWRDVAMSSDGKIQTAVAQGGNIYVSSDYGNTWSAKDSARSWVDVAMSANGKIQTAVANGGNIYVSSDYGNTWTQTGIAQGWWGVAMSSDGKIQTATGFTNTYISNDYGNTWTQTGTASGWYSVAMSSDGKIQTELGSSTYIYVSSDYGNTWSAKENQRTWFRVAMSSDGKIQTATNYGGNIYVSSDYGNTWSAKDSARYWWGVAMSSDGKIQTALEINGKIYVSTDYGNTWSAKDSNRAWLGMAMSSDGKIQTATVTSGGYIYTSKALDYYRGIMSIGPTPTNNFAFSVNNGGKMSANKFNQTSGNNVTVGVWNHVTMTYESNNKITFYINGEKVQEVISSPASNLDGVLKIGYEDASKSAFIGQIDELMLFNKILTDAEIKNMYEASK